MLAQDIGGGADSGNLAYLDRLYSDCGPDMALSQFHYARVGGRDSKSQILVQDGPFLRNECAACLERRSFFFDGCEFLQRCKLSMSSNA